jgi:hypothetical protein
VDVVNLINNKLDTIGVQKAGLWAIGGIVQNTRVSGTGTYRVTPRSNNGEGLPVIFSLTLAPNLKKDGGISVQSKTAVYQNGESVPIYALESTPLPDKVTLIWAEIDASGNAFELSSPQKDATFVEIGRLGSTNFPAFTAVNLTADTITATYGIYAIYGDTLCKGYDFGNAGKLAEIIIKVRPNTIEDKDLLADPVADQTICFGTPFDDITFTARRSDGVELAAVSYLVTFDGGDDVIDLGGTNKSYKEVVESLSGLWAIGDISLSTLKSGKGTYRVTPRSQNGEGVPVIFNLSVAPDLTKVSIDLAGKTIIYRNGERIDPLTLATNLPEGISVEWAVAAGSDNIGLLPTSGVNVIPAFDAENLGSTILTRVFNLTLKYGVSCSYTTEPLTIRVYPKTNEDLDLVMNPVAPKEICNSDNYEAFGPMALQAIRTAGAQPPFAVGDDISYYIEFVEGVNILDLVYNHSVSGRIAAATGATLYWVPTIAIENGKLKTGKGTYRVIPRWKNNEGLPVLFTLEHKPKLDSHAIDVQPMVFSNGDQVPEYRFKGVNIPVGASIVWRLKNGEPNVGTVVSGVDRIPAFLAVNTTSTAVTATYLAWLVLGDCTSEDDPIEFTIRVNPRTVEDYDFSIIPIASQKICFGENFANINLTATHRFIPNFNESTTFQWDLIDGVDVLGLGTTGTIMSSNNKTVWTISNNPKVLVPGTGTYRIMPIWNNNRGIATIITLTRLPEAIVNPVSDIVLCNNSELPLIKFTGTTNTLFDWQIINNTNPNNPVATTSVLGLPSKGTNEIWGQRLINNTNVHITETVMVTPHLIDEDGNACEGRPIKFTITVLPTPVANPIANVLTENGSVVPDILFTGKAVTGFRWYTSNAAINADKSAPTNGIGNKFPSFTAENITGEPIQSLITVTPIYIYTNGTTEISCEGLPVEFYITVAPKPYIFPLKNIRVCEGEITQPIVPEGLAIGAGYHIEWTVSDERIGLANHVYSKDGYKLKSIPGLNPATILPGKLSEPSVVVVTVKPLLTTGNTTFTGDPVNFTITVVPKTRLNQGYEEGITTDAIYCVNDPVSIDVPATGYDLKYQWYKDNIAIPGADHAVYEINAIKVEHSGKYYAVVSGECGSSLKSKTYDVKAKPNIVSQRWNDALVLNTNPRENGGYDFVSYQWYSIKNGVTSKLTGRNISYLYVAGGLSPSESYYVEALTSNGLTFQSCPVVPQAVQNTGIKIYPNPVRAGETITVEIALGSTNPNQTIIQVLDITNRIVSNVPASGAKTQVKVPNIKGIYIVRILINDNPKSFKVIVE